MSIFPNLKQCLIKTDQDARHHHTIARKKLEAVWILRKVQVEELKMSVDKLKVDEKINMGKLKKHFEEIA